MISLRQRTISLVAVFLASPSGSLSFRFSSVSGQLALAGAKGDRIGNLQEERDQLNAKLNSADMASTGRWRRADRPDTQRSFGARGPSRVSSTPMSMRSRESVSAAGAGFA